MKKITKVLPKYTVEETATMSTNAPRPIPKDIKKPIPPPPPPKKKRK